MAKTEKSIKDTDALDGELIKKNPVGAPSKYTNDIPDKVYALMKEGKTNVDICAALDIPEATFYRWKKQHEDLADAYERGLPHCQKQWEEMGKAIMLGQIPKANATVYMAFMNNKFKGWAREPKDDATTNINIETIQVVQNLQQLTDEQLTAKIKMLQNKAEEDD